MRRHKSQVIGENAKNDNRINILNVIDITAQRLEFVELSNEQILQVMKKLLILLAFSAFLGSCQESEEPQNTTTLTDAELETLLFTREEEKLAHDVYLYAFQKYGTFIFQNIGNSESSHIQSVLNLMLKYGISDPLNGSTVQGQFTDPVIIQLYQDLTARVDISLASAMEVGLYIEDLDIYDLDLAMAETQKADIINVYQSLRCGSTNHMRSFENQATGLGVSYTPEFITLDLFNEIINSSIVKCGSN